MTFIKLYRSLPSDEDALPHTHFPSNLLDWPSRLLDISYKLRCILPASRYCTGISPFTDRSLYFNDGFISNSPVHRQTYISTLAINLAHPRAPIWANAFHRPLNSWSRSSNLKAERDAGPVKALASIICRLKPDRCDLPRHRQKSGSFAPAEKGQKDNATIFEAGSDLGGPAGWCRSDVALGLHRVAKR